MASTAERIGRGIEAALVAVTGQDAAAFGAATAELAALPAEQTGLVLGGALRELLEVAHPDGLDGDDIQAALARTLRAALAWLPELDPAGFVAALTGALGVTEPDESPPAPAVTQPAALLLIADLAAVARVPPAAAIRNAFAEIERAETVELP
ncbi:hypothetical protein [Nocardia harenae]|uniref:hypothetical protein n=1 Tax=Nocardia harenae TaxID=358707 RepID=UPI0008355707|nr:hypothetical protein [Nocardia harenae]